MRTLTALALAALFSVAAQAQNASTPGIDQRQANQEARIDQGIASGTLNKREARRLNHQQRHIDNAENKAKADGTVTKAERRRLHHMQDHGSRRIYRQKHDAQTAPKS
jgi:opacity protein-like surface antigen